MSGLPRSPATVENLATRSVVVPGANTAARVYPLTSPVTSNRPNAPLPLAWGCRSGTRSRFHCAICSMT